MEWIGNLSVAISTRLIPGCRDARQVRELLEMWLTVVVGGWEMHLIHLQKIRKQNYLSYNLFNNFWGI